MIDLFLRQRSLLGRYLVIPLLVAAVGLLGPAAAAQLACPPDCDMLEPVSSLPTCCEDSDVVHEPTITAQHSPHSSPSPEPCCEDKPCLDSSAVVPEVTIALSSIECEINAPASVRGQAPLIQSASPARFFSEPDVKGPPIPVYIRTCVYLI
jgi:hypothetical protein